VLDRIDEIVQPGTTINRADNGWTSQALESVTRRPLAGISALDLPFPRPALPQRVGNFERPVIIASICEGVEMSASGVGSEPITQEGIEALREEIERLEGPARSEMAARIKAARELGDLKENADYHIAKEDQAHLETRIKTLKDRLRKAVVIDVDRDANSFAFGRTAEVLDVTSGDVNTWTLVGSTEANLAQGRLSAESPVGRALKDRKVDERVEIETPRGKRAFVVKKLLL
jgi:transcription elongation factor GreA